MRTAQDDPQNFFSDKPGVTFPYNVDDTEIPPAPRIQGQRRASKRQQLFSQDKYNTHIARFIHASKKAD